MNVNRNKSKMKQLTAVNYYKAADKAFLRTYVKQQ